MVVGFDQKIVEEIDMIYFVYVGVFCFVYCW